jgi:energy-coupling factor transporter ATP-binding protein EcfA2
MEYTHEKNDTTSISATNDDGRNLPIIASETDGTTQPLSHAHKFLGEYGIIISTDGTAYLYNKHDSQEPVYKLGSKKANAIILQQAHKNDGGILRTTELKEFNELFTTVASMENRQNKVNSYVAEIEDGVEVDLGDEGNTHAVITAGKVTRLSTGSENLFYRDNNYLPFPYPAKEGDINKLNSYLGNMNAGDRILFIVFLAYTLAHPKSPQSKYVILVLLGGQGSGKSFLSNIISALISPSLAGNQVLPKNQKDLIITAQNSHVVLFDNVRKLTQQQSDDLCVMSTGGHISCRQLYTDSEQLVMPLHACVVLNGMHDFITESDLAQRSLVLRLSSMDEDKRVSEKQLQAGLKKDLPTIFKGLLDLIAQILEHLPNVEVSNPERMLDYVHWLAAKEKIDDVPAGTYQKLYSANIKEGQIESMLDDVLAAAVTEFAQSLEYEWQDEPGKLFAKLTLMAPHSSQRSSQWPKTVNAMSKRLRSLQVALRAQDIYIEFGRNEKRWILVKTDTTESRY